MHFQKILIAAASIIAATNSLASPTLIKDSIGEIQGATGIEFNGATYNVSFSITPQGGFNPSNQSWANDATNALISQVLTDLPPLGPTEGIDSPYRAYYKHRTAGCYGFSDCTIATAYGAHELEPGFLAIDYVGATYSATLSTVELSAFNGSIPVGVETEHWYGNNFTWANWTLTTPTPTVPEPDAIYLAFAGVGILALTRKQHSKIRIMVTLANVNKKP